MLQPANDNHPARLVPLIGKIGEGGAVTRAEVVRLLRIPDVLLRRPTRA